MRKRKSKQWERFEAVTLTYEAWWGFRNSYLFSQKQHNAWCWGAQRRWRRRIGTLVLFIILKAIRRHNLNTCGKQCRKYENDIWEEHGEEDAEMMCLLEAYIQVVSVAYIKSCMGDFKSSIKMNHTVNAGFICLRRARPSSIIASCLHQSLLKANQPISIQATNMSKQW